MRRIVLRNGYTDTSIPRCHLNLTTVPRRPRQFHIYAAVDGGPGHISRQTSEIDTTVGCVKSQTPTNVGQRNAAVDGLYCDAGSLGHECFETDGPPRISGRLRALCLNLSSRSVHENLTRHDLRVRIVVGPSLDARAHQNLVTGPALDRSATVLARIDVQNPDPSGGLLTNFAIPRAVAITAFVTRQLFILVVPH